MQRQPRKFAPRSNSGAEALVEPYTLHLPFRRLLYNFWSYMHL
jgi:hypothetical protein